MGQSPTWGRLWGRAHSVMGSGGYAVGQCYGAEVALWVTAIAVGQTRCYGAEGSAMGHTHCCGAEVALWVTPSAIGQR